MIITYEFYHNKQRLLDAAFQASITARARKVPGQSYSDHYSLWMDLNKWRLLKTDDYYYISALPKEKFPVKVLNET